MGDNAIIFQALGVLIALFFIFLTVMNFKSWRWLHALTTFAVFCAVVTFAVYASLVLKTRVAWEKTHDQLTKNLATEEKAFEKLTQGDPADEASMKNSLAALRSQLAREIIDRGRVWRNCTPVLNPPDATGTVTVTVTMAAAPVAAPTDPAVAPAVVGAAPAAPAAAGAPKKHGIDPKLSAVLFAFIEGVDAEGRSVPAVYLGEFETTAITDTSVTLKMSVPPYYGRPPIQPSEVQSTWMLYDVPPPDAHEAFLSLFPPEATKEQRMAVLQTLLPQANFQGVPPEVYAKIIEGYARDGLEGSENDHPDNTWVEMKFSKSHEIPVDAATMVPPVEERHYDADGKSQNPRLIRDDKKGVTFAPNTPLDTGIFDYATATKLQEEGKAVRQRLIYRRKLNDYEHAFQAINRKLFVLAERAAFVKRDTETAKAATERANAQIMLEEADKMLVEADLAKISYERDETKKYADTLNARMRAMRAELSRLYSSNKQLHAELLELNQRLADEVERRTKEATALSDEKK